MQPMQQLTEEQSTPAKEQEQSQQQLQQIVTYTKTFIKLTMNNPEYKLDIKPPQFLVVARLVNETLFGFFNDPYFIKNPKSDEYEQKIAVAGKCKSELNKELVRFFKDGKKMPHMQTTYPQLDMFAPPPSKLDLIYHETARVLVENGLIPQNATYPETFFASEQEKTNFQKSPFIHRCCNAMRAVMMS